MSRGLSNKENRSFSNNRHASSLANDLNLRPKREHEQTLTSTSQTPNNTEFLELTQYADKITQNNKAYQQELFKTKLENTNLKNEIEKVIGDSLKSRNQHSEETSKLKGQFSEQINQLVDELKMILSEKEKMESDYKGLIEELNEQHLSEVRQKEAEVLKIEEIFTEKVLKLQVRVEATEKQNEKSYFDASENKLEMLKRIDELNYDCGMVRKHNEELKAECEGLKSIVKEVEARNGELQQIIDQLQMEKYRVEQEKNTVIIELKSTNKALNEKQRLFEGDIRDLTLLVDEKKAIEAKDLATIKKQEKDLDTLTIKLSQTRLQLEDKCQALQSCENKLKKQQDLFKGDRSFYEDKIDSSEREKQLLSQNLSEMTAKLHSAQESSVRNELQAENLLRKLQSLTFDYSNINQSHHKTQSELKSLRHDYNDLQLEFQSLKEKTQIQQNHITTLERINQQLKQTKDLTIIQEQERSLEIEKRHKNAQMERDIGMEREVESMKRAMQSLQLQNRDLSDEIEGIIRLYEGKLYDREREFKSRLETMEYEIEVLLKDRMMRRS